MPVEEQQINITIPKEKLQEWNVFFALPCYDSHVTEPFTMSLLQTPRKSLRIWSARPRASNSQWLCRAMRAMSSLVATTATFGVLEFGVALLGCLTLRAKHSALPFGRFQLLVGTH